MSKDAFERTLAMSNRTQLAQKANIAQEAWITPTLLNNWVDYDAVNYSKIGYMKDAFGFVHIKGIIKSGTNGQNIFVLPTGYRPSKKIMFSPKTGSTTVGYIEVLSDGGVFGATTSATYTSIDIVFKEGQ